MYFLVKDLTDKHFVAIIINICINRLNRLNFFYFLNLLILYRRIYFKISLNDYIFNFMQTTRNFLIK